MLCPPASVQHQSALERTPLPQLAACSPDSYPAFKCSTSSCASVRCRSLPRSPSTSRASSAAFTSGDCWTTCTKDWMEAALAAAGVLLPVAAVAAGAPAARASVGSGVVMASLLRAGEEAGCCWGTGGEGVASISIRCREPLRALHRSIRVHN